MRGDWFLITEFPNNEFIITCDNQTLAMCCIYFGEYSLQFVIGPAM